MGNKKEILNTMLDIVSDNFDKREGSFIYDSLAPVAEGLSYRDNDLKGIESKFKTSNLSGDELSYRVSDITGMERKKATRSIGEIVVSGTGNISIGNLFETSQGIQFRSIEDKEIIESGTINIEAVTAGSNSNVAANTITMFPITISGITAVNNLNPTIDGFNEESDKDLRERYYERLRTPATSGNKVHYVNWAKEVQGVGEAKVFSLWNGDNTVKVVIIDADREPASAELVETVQNYIDPNSLGLGEGVAPLGAYCTVTSAIEKTIDVIFDLVIDPSYTLEEVEPLVEESLTNFLRGIAFKADTVSYALIGANIINTSGVLDYNNLQVNLATANIVLGDEEAPVLGSVIINE